MKIEVVIKQTQSATIDIGELPVNLVRDLLNKNEGTFDGNWGLSDVARGNEKWTVDSIEIEEVAKK